MLRKLELGCGQRPEPGYLHQDVAPQEGVELDFACSPWEVELPENSLDIVIANGVMEHLRFHEFHQTLAHIQMMLVSGGYFLFDVPDMQVWSEYLYNLTHDMQHKNPFEPEHIWSTIYGWQRWPGDEHKSGWTRNAILDAIKSAGFRDFEEGAEHYLALGIHRNRFTRPGDAHLIIKAIK